MMAMMMLTIMMVVMLRAMSKTVMKAIIMVVIKLMSMITKNKAGVEKREQETDHCGYAKPQSQMEETSAVKTKSFINDSSNNELFLCQKSEFGCSSISTQSYCY